MRAYIKRVKKNWFPHDPINLKSVLKATFLDHTNRDVRRRIIAIFISAIILVLVKNAYHQAFMKLQALKADHDNLQTEWMQLMIEESTWGNYDRINAVATAQLNMTVPSPFNTTILVIDKPEDTKIRDLANDSILDKTEFDQGYLPTTQGS